VLRPDPTSPSQLRALFRRYGFRPRRRLGQTFLVDANVAGKIVRAAQLTGAQSVLEIGPGAGAVTRLLVQQARRVVAVEVDPVLVAMLGETAGPEVEVVEADFLTVDLDSVLASHTRAPRVAQASACPDEPRIARASPCDAQTKETWRCVANLPYAITGPAIMRLLEAASWFDRMVIMVQQEVAQRLLAPAGDRARGLLTVLAEASCQVSAVGQVSRRCFYPRPQVDSTILSFAVRRPPSIPPGVMPFFERVVKAAFSTRRKTLANALSGPSGLGLKKQDAILLLSQSGIAPGRRAESLSADEFMALTKRLTHIA
jgi:16S rRNA (adenine1518-N6/adenine1519-N6)-dimethyltransferase